MFATHTLKTVEIQEGNVVISVICRKLSARSLEKAAEIRQGTVLTTMKNTGKDVLEAMKSADTGPKDIKKKTFKELDAEERRTSFYASYDRPTILRSGIQSWSASDPAFALPPVETGIDDLDEETSDKLFIEVMDLAIPPVNVAKAAESKD